jgi:hypothetical protein
VHDPQLPQVSVARRESELALHPCPCHSLSTLLLLLRQWNSFFSRRVMSSFTSASCSSWLQYGVVPLTRCPTCPHLEPLKQLTCTTDENTNRVRELVKCERRPYKEREGWISHQIARTSFNFLFPQILYLGFTLLFSDLVRAFSSGLMCTLIGFDWRNHLAQLGSSIWGALARENAADT